MIRSRAKMPIRPKPRNGASSPLLNRVNYDEVWATVDPLGEALHFLRMTGTFYSRAEFTAPWGLMLPPMRGCLMFHFVTQGGCALEVGRERHRLQRGDLVLVPHGKGHVLASERGVRAAKLFDLPRELVSERYEVLRHGGGGSATTMICGAVRFEHPAAQRLITLLPHVIRIEAISPRLHATEGRGCRAGRPGRTDRLPIRSRVQSRFQTLHGRIAGLDSAEHVQLHGDDPNVGNTLNRGAWCLPSPRNFCIPFCILLLSRTPARRRCGGISAASQTHTTLLGLTPMVQPALPSQNALPA